MTDITTYPLEDWFETNLSQDWDWSIWTIYVNNTPSFTFPLWVTTYVIVDPGKSNMQLAEISAYSSSLKTITVSNITLDKWAGVSYTQQSHNIWAVVRISHNYQFWKDMVDSINSKIDGNSADIEFGKFANATARDAYFTSPVNGNSAYLIAEWKRTDYVAWAWADRASGTNPNASDTVAGKVEIATQAEFDAWTATGWTWASVVATNDQIRKQINTATAKTNPVNADSIGIANSAADWVIYKTTLTEFKAASDMQATTTTSGFVELATDAEALAWTDQTRYINAKQAKDNYANTSSYVTGTRSTTGTWVTIAHWLWKIPTLITVMFVENVTNYVGQWTCNNSLNQTCFWTNVGWQWLVSWKFIDTNWFNATVTAIDATNITVTRAWTWVSTTYYIYSKA